MPRIANAKPTERFFHGVASGDPLTDAVIIWTRLTPPDRPGALPVKWEMATDPGMKRVVQARHTFASASRDFTIKVDVDGLQPGTTYYYQFKFQGDDSPVGRTRTLPAGSLSRLRIGVASCSNLPYGFFNSYRALANR